MVLTSRCIVMKACTFLCGGTTDLLVRWHKSNIGTFENLEQNGGLMIDPELSLVRRPEHGTYSKGRTSRWTKENAPTGLTSKLRDLKDDLCRVVFARAFE